jgi:hypothetical protein
MVNVFMEKCPDNRIPRKRFSVISGQALLREQDEKKRSPRALSRRERHNRTLDN